MALTLALADAALKEDYLPSIREQLNQDFPFLAQIERNSKDVEGRRAVLSLHVKRNSGVGARAEGGTLPTAGNQGYAEERVPLRYNYARIQINGPVIKAMKSDRGSFTRAVSSEVNGALEDLKRDVNRQLFGTSNGVIATCGTTTTSNDVVLLNPTTVQLGQLEVGMVVDIGTVASPSTVAAGRTITAVTTTGFTIDGATISTTSGTHFVFRQGAGGATTAQKELTGLQTIVDSSGTLFNVDPSSYPVWSSYEKGSIGAVSDVVFERAIHAIRRKGGGAPNLLVTSDGVERAYSATLTSQKRFANTIELKGGYSGLSVGAGGSSLSLMWDRDCPYQTAFILNTNHLFQHEMSDWEWMDDDGAVLSRVSGVDAYEATLYKYHELTTDQRNAHGKLTGIDEDVDLYVP